MIAHRNGHTLSTPQRGHRRRVELHYQWQRHVANDLFLTIRTAERRSWPAQYPPSPGFLGFKTLGGYARGAPPDFEFIKGLSLSEPRVACPPHAFFMPKDVYLDFLSELGYEERAVWDDLMLHRATRAIWHMNQYSEARGGKNYYQRNTEVDERTANLSLELLEFAEIVKLSSTAAREVEALLCPADEVVANALRAAQT